jgi:galactose-6-phosphate isomerase
MSKEIIGLFVKNNPELLADIKKYLETKKDKDVVVYNEGSEFESLVKLGTDLKSEKVGRGLAFDEYGNLPFMVLAKLKNVVCAQISDSYSAHMTMEHNGSNALALGYDLLTSDNLYRILDLYLDEKFAAGRHMVRVNMMCELQREEK